MLQLSPLIKDISWDDTLSMLNGSHKGWHLPTLMQVLLIMKSHKAKEFCPDGYVWTLTNFDKSAFIVSFDGTYIKVSKRIEHIGINARFIIGGMSDIHRWIDSVPTKRNTKRYSIFGFVLSLFH